MQILRTANGVLIGVTAALAFVALACGSSDSTGAGASGAGGSAGASGTGGAGTAGTGGAAGAGGSAMGGSGAGGSATAHDTNLGSCTVFPADNVWNKDVSGDPVDPNSDSYIAYINANGGTKVHPDFGSNPDYGIPYVAVPGTQPKVDVQFDYADESDPGPYPIPDNAPIEGGSAADGDRHVLVIDRDVCLLYETYDSHYVGPGWHCGSGAKWDLKTGALRPEGWTSADAAGLPIFPGLARYDEAVTAGVITHALRFTVVKSQQAYVHPATHFASNITDPTAPPMGMRVRMKASYDISTFTGASKVIATALKKYGMFVADNGSNWYISGASDPNFNDDELGQLKNVPGTAFEVVQLGALVTQ